MTDTPERPWKTCNDCNYDRHVCTGCGEPITHAQGRVCPACSTDCKHEMMKASCADCRGLGEVADPYDGVELMRTYTAAQYEQACALFPDVVSDEGATDAQGRTHLILEGERFGLVALPSRSGGTARKRGYVCDTCVAKLLSGISVG